MAEKYIYDPRTETGDWTGDPVEVPAAEVYNMTPVPLNGYPDPPSEVIACDVAFTAMLSRLQSAWTGGGAPALNAAITSMGALRNQATALLMKGIPRTDAPGIYGPQFRMAAAGVAPINDPDHQGTVSIPVSFDHDIKPLFRGIDVDHMRPFGVLLDDYTYMSDPAGNRANANAVLDVLRDQSMPPGGPFWSKENLDLLARWIADECQP